MLFKYTIDLVREGFKKDVDLSTFWWVGGSGWGQNPQKKQKNREYTIQQLGLLKLWFLEACSLPSTIVATLLCCLNPNYD